MGARRDYEVTRLGQANAHPLPRGAEVVYRVTAPANTAVSLSVESKTPGFVPLMYTISHSQTCLDCVNGDCSYTTRFDTLETPYIFHVVVGSEKAGVDGDFELVVGARATSATGQPGQMGVDAGTAPTGNIAEKVWKSTRGIDVEATRQFYLTLITNWSDVATRTANSNTRVTTGTLNETSPGVYQYSSLAIPSNELRINRIGGDMYMMSISKLTGVLSPRIGSKDDDYVEFTWKSAGTDIKGTVSRTKFLLSGTGFLSETATAISTFNIVKTSMFSLSTDNEVVTIRAEYKTTGFIRNSQHDIEFNNTTDIYSCTGIKCPNIDDVSMHEFDETTIVDGKPYQLQYVYARHNSNHVTPTNTRHQFTGIVMPGGFIELKQVVGTLYSRDIVIGNDRYSIDRLHSYH